MNKIFGEFIIICQNLLGRNSLQHRTNMIYEKCLRRVNINDYCILP